MSRTAALLLLGHVALGVLGLGCGGSPRAAGCPYDKAESVANEGWTHVKDEDQLDYQHNPPASGPHFPVWASWGVHQEQVPRGNWVHNLEHGGIVLLIGPDASDADRTRAQAAWDAIPNDPECGHRRMVLTDDPDLDSDLAVVAADIVLEGGALKIGDIVDFATTCRNRAPEDVCQ